MLEAILVINAGSSSLKIAIFDYQTLTRIYHGLITINTLHGELTIYENENRILHKNLANSNYDSLIAELFTFANTHCQIKIVGHRVVHGGQSYCKPTIVNQDVLDNLEKLVVLAPLHQGHNLEAIKNIRKLNPNLPQVACFDTAFHTTQNKLAKLFAIPKSLTNDGVIRYGFHGLSYEYIASQLVSHLDSNNQRKVIIAHLGNGASMCALKDGKSIATSMGFTALDGLMMGSRCGMIDPGVILYLQQAKGYDIQQIEHLLYNESGLLGVSGISNDVRTLVASTDPDARLALDLFCYMASVKYAELSVALSGADALVFTGGIGENCAFIRQEIAKNLEFLGIKLDSSANSNNHAIISAFDSKVQVAIIATNEEMIIAKNTKEQIS